MVDHQAIQLNIEGNNVQVNKFTYLGQTLKEDAQLEIDIRRRIVTVKRAFKEKHTLQTKNMQLELQKQILQMCTLYGFEMWTINRGDEKRTKAFEI